MKSRSLVNRLLCCIALLLVFPIISTAAEPVQIAYCQNDYFVLMGGDVNRTKMAKDSNGNLYLIYAEDESPNIGSYDAKLKFVYSNDGGKTWSAPVVLGEKLNGMEGGNGMKDLIGYIAKALVDQPEKVSVNEIEGEHTNVLELSVDKSDMGKIIGKQGRNAQALRTILSAASAKNRKRCILEIVE